MAVYVPERGDLVWLSLDPQQGHEQAGRRPCLVLSKASYNRATNLAVIVPLSNQSKNYPFEVPVPDGVAVTGVALCDQGKNVDWKPRHADFIAAMPSDWVEKVARTFVSLLPVTLK